MEVQEDLTSGRVRVNIFDKIREIYPDNVHIKVIGSENEDFMSGETDLRGVFVAEGIHLAQEALRSGAEIESFFVAPRLASTSAGRELLVAIETCGAVPFDSFRRVLPFVDLILFDVKAIDPELHENVEPSVSVLNHVRDWTEAIRNGTTPTGNIDLAIKAHTVVCLAEMSNRMGEMLHFDPATRVVTTGSGRRVEPLSYGVSG